MKSAFDIALCALMAWIAPIAIAQSPVDGLALNSSKGWQVEALQNLDAPTFDTWQQRAAGPADDPRSVIEIRVTKILRPSPQSSSSRDAAIRAVWTIDCRQSPPRPNLKSTTVYNAHGKSISEAATPPATYAALLPSDHPELKSATAKCGSSPFAVSPVTLVEMPPAREFPSKYLAPLLPPAGVDDIAAMIDEAQQRDADYSLAKKLPQSGAFVVASTANGPVIIDTAGLSPAANEPVVTAIRFVDRKKTWYVRATGRVNCTSGKVAPELQVAYDAADQVKVVRRPHPTEFNFPGTDGFGAMFAPTCGVLSDMSGQTVYLTLTEAIEAARKDT